MGLILQISLHFLSILDLFLHLSAHLSVRPCIFLTDRLSVYLPKSLQPP